MGDILKHFISTACAYYAYGAIAKYSAEDTLIYIYGLYFIEVHLQCTAADEAGFDDDTMIGDRKLIRPA